ncbi:four helix bundle protein [Aliifodinibius sp. S!AR15-10]|uniref:four helix bundle protein n=1 Tax=Aliifodinibius sp. S!AR15-10 TaxID=2950437 RepID=UPI00285F2DCC|nr:four helix bundle protein [Aliifodinibius sp. S!AR15-10]MDR8393388.1 four helix bundle protein [Aliifodinibius sp. S!AR15-10]
MNTDFAFKDLKVWERAIEFADFAISLSENLDTPQNHFRLVEQFESACTSVSMNIAEGKGRRSKKEFIQYLYIARGSLYETITLATIFHKRNWITNEDFEKLENEALEIASMTKGLINAIKKS